jgi:hypothetical protein
MHRLHNNSPEPTSRDRLSGQFVDQRIVPYSEAAAKFVQVNQTDDEGWKKGGALRGSHTVAQIQQ